jgi:tetratricopeptide (TPR) repeat protein
LSISLEEQLNSINSKILNFPTDNKLKFKKSEILFELNKFDQSLDVMETISYAQYSTNLSYLHQKLKLYEKLSKFESAEECCNLLIEINPTFLNFLKLGTLQIKLKNISESEDSLIHCLNRLPKNFLNVFEILENLEKLSKDNNFLKLKNELELFKNNLNKYHDKINLDAEKEKINKNIELNDKELEIHPISHNALQSKANSLTTLEKYSEAVDIYNKLLELVPNDYKVLRSKAYALSKSEKCSEAVDIYNKLLQLQPNNASLLQSKAYCLTTLEKYTEAVDIYNKLLELVPNDYKVLRSKAYALYNAKQFHSSLQLIETILDNPNHVDIELAKLYAKIYVKIFSNEDPTTFLISKINLNKHNFSWYGVLIKFHKNKNNLSKIIELFENNPLLLNESIFLTELGHVYEIQNNFVESIRYHTLALEKDPNNHWALFSRGQCNIILKQYDLALKDFETGFDISQKIYFRESYAYTLDLLGQFDKSISILSRYKNSHRRLNVLKVLGLIYRNNRKYDESLDCYLQILQENENDSNGLIGCALVYDSQSEYDLALKNIEKSLETNGYDEFTMKIKVEILIKMNNFEDAQKNLTLMQQNKSTVMNSKIDSNSEYSSYIKSAVREELEKINSTSVKNNIEDRTIEIKNLYNLPLEQIFKNTESDILEYKSTLRYDLKKKESNKELEIEVLQTICAFLNTHGGILVVGYNDDEKAVQGLEKDYGTIGRRKDWDGWQQKLENLIKNSIGTTYSGFIVISKETFHDDNEQKDIAKIKVQKSSRSAFLKMDNSNVFFARRNGQSDKLDSKETQEWIKDHNLN